MVSSIKMSRNRLVNSNFLTGRRCSANLSETSAHFTDIKFATFTARNAVNDVGGGACKIVPKNEIGFRSGNGCGRVEERTRVTTSTRARKGTGAGRFCLRVLRTKLSRMFLLHLKEMRVISENG